MARKTNAGRAHRAVAEEVRATSAAVAVPPAGPAEPAPEQSSRQDADATPLEKPHPDHPVDSPVDVLRVVVPMEPGAVTARRSAHGTRRRRAATGRR